MEFEGVVLYKDKVGGAIATSCDRVCHRNTK